MSPFFFYFSSVTLRGPPLYLRNQESYHGSAGVKVTGKKIEKNSIIISPNKCPFTLNYLTFPPRSILTPKNMYIYALFIDCCVSHLRTFCRQIHQCAKIGGWGRGVKPILAMPRLWKCLLLQGALLVRLFSDILSINQSTNFQLGCLSFPEMDQFGQKQPIFRR